MIKKFVHLVNSVPFAGRLQTKKVSHNLWIAHTRMERIKRFLYFLFWLGLYIWAHSVQSFMGFLGATVTTNIILDVILVTYGVVNFAVTIAQVHLLFRAIRYCFKSLPKVERVYVSETSTIEALGVLATLLGQIIAGGAFLLAIHLAS